MIDKIPGAISGLPTLPQTPKIGASDKAQGSSFGSALKEAMAEMVDLQGEADQKIKQLSAGTGKVSTHDAMIALEKADVAFSLMNSVKTKIVQAYQEVMRTSV